MELTFFRCNHNLVIATIILMIWISLNESREIELIRYPPCSFNSLCSCSKAVPDLGIVQCHNVHLPRIPETVNISKVFMLHLENNNLRTIEPYFLQSTGLYKITISQNPLYLIPDEAFLGLERSLWELELSYNHLTHVPNRAIRYLQKLRSLNLRGNDIVKITPENWRGLESSLVELILSDNSITTLSTKSFSGLPFLETIDLRGNNLKQIDPSLFWDGMGKLANLILADNQLTAIPYQALYYLKALKNLDLGYNRINTLQPGTHGAEIININFQLNLDVLHLDYNQITQLEPVSFKYFNVLNKTYLDGNPIEVIQDNAFRQAIIKELYIRNCNLKQVSPSAFTSLENSLEILDLSGNHISALSDETLSRFVLLRTLALKDNALSKLNPTVTFSGLQFTLYKLDLSGSNNAPVSIQDLRSLRNLRVLSLSRLSKKSLSSEDFLQFGIDLEELEIVSGGLKTVKANAFKHIHGLKMLKLSNNIINTVEDKAFADIDHSLVTLILSNAFSSSMSSLPTEAIKVLTNLEELDVSNNRIKNLPATSFHFLKHLKRLYLQDNIIDIINKGTFQGDIHRELSEIYFSFNNIKQIQQHSFVGLSQLEQLHLDDNQLETLNNRAFMNLEKLKRLNLKGNKITTISSESFLNLPDLEDLDLSYNKLSNFDFNMFDQVGTLSMFHVNVSHNKLVKLGLPESSEIGPVRLHSNIKVLDMSFNNITIIGNQFFHPIELSLSHLYLSHNQLLNATKNVFGSMPHLQLLDISHNSIYELDFDTFRYTKKLQVLLASNNRLAEIPNDLFRFLGNLRIVDFSHNRLRGLPDNLFRETGLERLDVSHNFLSKLPLTSVSVASAVTLCELDLSWNEIASISHGGLLTRFKSLTFLDLSYNRLSNIDGGTFKGVPRLSSLNLGHNSQLTLEINDLSLQGLEYSLLHLNLDNVSLSHVPILRIPNLVSLSLAHNALPIISTEMASNISLIQRLNVDYNDLNMVPIVTHSLNELRYLSIAGNPLNTLTNTSLLGVAPTLKELDLSHIDFTDIETGAFCKLQSLRTLKLELAKNVKSFNIPTLLQFSNGLKTLVVHIENNTESIEKEFQGELPTKLQNVTFEGKGLKKLFTKIFQGVRHPSFHFGLHNSSVMKITSDIFKNMPHVRNISLDVRGNLALTNLQNPSTGFRPNLPKSIFLTDLQMTGGKWSCDCDLGWIEVWQRKKRQYMCGSSPSLSPFHNSPEYLCRHTDEELRRSLCANKNNQTIIDVLKADIECGWSAASSNYLTNLFSTLLLIACQLWINF